MSRIEEPGHGQPLHASPATESRTGNRGELQPRWPVIPGGAGAERRWIDRGRSTGPVLSAVSPSPLQRAEALLRTMTIEEKAMQLSSVLPLSLFTPAGIDRSQLDARLKNGIGHVCALGLVGHKPPETLARTINAIQHYLVTETRLKIPAIFHSEAMSGVVAPHFTAFPSPIALAATWDPDAIEEMAQIIRRQMRATGMLQALAPVLDLARDARWGRVSECYGEEPYLVGSMGVAFTRGLQGEDLTQGVLATARHFVGYGATDGGQDMAATAATPRELYDVYARPFEAAIRLAGLAAVMPSYSECDGVPVSASYAVLTEMLRDRMGFEGTTVSGYAAVEFLQTRQRVAANAEEAGVLALDAGMDVETPTIYGYGEVLARAVRNGRISEALLDRSVCNVLRDKYALGLFENPYVPEDPVRLRIVASEGTDLSRRLAHEAVTLLKNEDGVLPLPRDVARVAVIGPHADDLEAGFSTYTYPAALRMMHASVSGGEVALAGIDVTGAAPIDGLAAAAAELGPVLKGNRRSYLRSNYSAVSLAEAIRRILPDAQVNAVAGTGILPSEPSDIPAAVAAAKAADVVILAVGGRSAWSAERTEGEGADSARRELPSQQVELIEAVTAVGKPTVAVVSIGGPHVLTPVIEKVPAVITAFYAGPYHASALAEAIFGVSNPAGKLPFTLPRHAGQLPIHVGQRWGSGYRRTETDPYQGYQDVPATPLFPFGHGLSYTTFDYGQLELKRERVDVSGEIHATLTVANTGRVRGTEVVQLYAADTATGVTLPAQQLVGFARVDLEPGQKKRVEFWVPLSVLAYTGMTDEVVMEPGPIELSAGSSAGDLRTSATVMVTGTMISIDGEEREFLSSSAVRSC